MPAGETDSPKHRNVILIGFMGTGKSTVGRRVASGLRFEFADTDQLIEARAGSPIPGIFADRGETYFRDVESAVLENLAGREEMVISTGGGAVLRDTNRTLLKRLGFVAWLDATEDTIYARVSRKQDRPLLFTGDPRETIARLLAERRALYGETADLTVSTDALSVEEIAHGIIDSAQVYFSRGKGQLD